MPLVCEPLGPVTGRVDHPLRDVGPDEGHSVAFARLGLEEPVPGRVELAVVVRLVRPERGQAVGSQVIGVVLDKGDLPGEGGGLLQLGDRRGDLLAGRCGREAGAVALENVGLRKGVSGSQSGSGTGGSSRIGARVWPDLPAKSRSPWAPRGRPPQPRRVSRARGSCRCSPGGGP